MRREAAGHDWRMNAGHSLVLVACHREDRHDRVNSRVATYSDLRFEVERWTEQTGRPFTTTEREQLVEYLDATHYRLDRQSLRR
jgi:hypothetical protein